MYTIVPCCAGSVRQLHAYQLRHHNHKLLMKSSLTSCILLRREKTLVYHHSRGPHHAYTRGLGTHTGTNSGVFAKLMDRLPQARHYYSDGFEPYQDVVYYHGRHIVTVGKRYTYTVEGCNADIRHCVAALARKTRCITRSPASLRDSICLFVFAYNLHRRHRFRYPQYPCSLTEFVSP